MKKLLFSALILCLSYSVRASESCNAKVLTNIGAMESPQSVLEKGEIIDYVRHYNRVIFKKSGYIDDNFCQHGGLLLPCTY